MDFFTYIYEKDKKKYIDVLGKESFDVTHNQWDLCLPDSNFRKNSLLYKVAIFFNSSLNQCSDSVLSYFQRILHIKIKDSLIFPPDKKEKNVSDLLDHCPGFIKVSYPNNGDNKEIRYLSIIFPWSIDALKVSHYLQFDGSFFAMRPFTFCLSQAIYFNESIPISITLAPTESIELYQMIIDHLNELSENQIQWDELIVLSDMGASIQSVCNSNKIKQFFCQRHILQHFGSSSVLSIFVNRLLRCYSFHQYLECTEEIEMELDLYIAEKNFY